MIMDGAQPSGLKVPNAKRQARMMYSSVFLRRKGMMKRLRGVSFEMRFREVSGRMEVTFFSGRKRVRRIHLRLIIVHPITNRSYGRSFRLTARWHHNNETALRW